MDDFEEMAKKAYPLWLKCISEDEWMDVQAADLPLINEFVDRCVSKVMKEIQS